MGYSLPYYTLRFFTLYKIRAYANLTIKLEETLFYTVMFYFYQHDYKQKRECKNTDNSACVLFQFCAGASSWRYCVPFAPLLSCFSGAKWMH